MSAPELLAEIEARGGKIAVAFDSTGAAKIQIAPRGIVGDLAGEIARFKPLLVELLAPAPTERPEKPPKTAQHRVQNGKMAQSAHEVENGAQNRNLGFDDSSDLRELARSILGCVRPGGGFDFGAVKNFWRAANEITGENLTAPELGAWARPILEIRKA